MLYSCTRMATVGVKELTLCWLRFRRFFYCRFSVENNGIVCYTVREPDWPLASRLY